MCKVCSFAVCFIILLTVTPWADAVSIDNLKKLDIPETNLWDPVLSPDGTKIAYIAYDSAHNQQIFVINSDGSGKKKLTDDKLKKWGLAWGPDRIAYVSYGKGGLEKIFVINPDGSDKKPLIPDDTRQGNPVEGNPPYWAAPSWSHDGKTMVYTSLDERGAPAIYMVSADGTGKRRLFSDTLKQWSPSISPDGRSIVYVSYDNRSKEELFIADTSGTTARQITFDGIKKNNPVWGPDGTIVYVSYESSSSSGEKIFAIKQDGTGRSLFVDSDFKQQSPSFSHDGKKFSYAAIDISGNVKIAVGDVIGTTAAVTPEPAVATPTVTVTLPAPPPAETSNIEETQPSGVSTNDVMLTMVLTGIIIAIIVLGVLILAYKKK